MCILQNSNMFCKYRKYYTTNPLGNSYTTDFPSINALFTVVLMDTYLSIWPYFTGTITLLIVRDCFEIHYQIISVSMKSLFNNTTLYMLNSPFHSNGDSINYCYIVNNSPRHLYHKSNLNGCKNRLNMFRRWYSWFFN